MKRPDVPDWLIERGEEFFNSLPVIPKDDLIKMAKSDSLNETVPDEERREG